MDLQRSPCDLAALVREVCARLAPLAEAKYLALSVETPEDALPADLDVVKVEQVVTNLVSNAVKYTETGAVAVRLDELANEEFGPCLRIRVRDTGIGIRLEDQARLFAPFTQVDSRPARPGGGTGLGLFLTARYVEMHGGRIEVRSEPGRGSEFTVLLPLETGAAGATSR
jgi:signal transduction histidine kinase